MFTGVGVGHRAYDIGNRSRIWKKTFGTNTFDVVIVEKGMSRENALELKKAIVSANQATIINKRKVQSFSDMDFEEFNLRFYVDPASPSGLSYKQQNGAYGKHRRVVGDNAGYRSGHRGKYYWIVKIKSKKYLVHRIVYLLENKSISKDLTINHKDGNGLNNNTGNLEQVTQAVNSRKKVLIGKSGYVNIQENVRCGVLKGYTFLGKSYGMKNKYFGVAKYGTAELALQFAVKHKVGVITDETKNKGNK